MLKHIRSSSRWNEDISLAGSTTSETTQTGELISGLSSMSKLHVVCIQPLFSKLFAIISQLISLILNLLYSRVLLSVMFCPWT